MKVPITNFVLAGAQERQDFLKKADKNRDGQISRDERAAMVGGPYPSTVAAFDREALLNPVDPRQPVSLAEANALETLAVAKHIKNFDRTGDGNIDGNEVRSFSYPMQDVFKDLWTQIEKAQTRK